MATYKDLIGSTVYDNNHEKIGSLDGFYVDDDTEKPTWMTVKSGMFGNNATFVPLQLAHETKEGLQIAVSKDQVKDAPRIEDDERISEDEEDKLRNYYYSTIDESDSVISHSTRDDEKDDMRSTSESESNDSMELSEEGLAANQQQQTGEIPRLRLKKYVVTDKATFEVPLRREEIRLVQEPATDSSSDYDQ